MSNISLAVLSVVYPTIHFARRPSIYFLSAWSSCRCPISAHHLHTHHQLSNMLFFHVTIFHGHAYPLCVAYLSPPASIVYHHFIGSTSPHCMSSFPTCMDFFELPSRSCDAPFPLIAWLFNVVPPPFYFIRGDNYCGTYISVFGRDARTRLDLK